ncbi:MAG: UDP-N-acetylmuramate dehydrogenase [Candidatus Zixiibacteriota bacterium]
MFGKLRSILGDKLRRDEILAPYTYFKIGGACDFFFEAKKIEDLINAVLLVQELKINYFILGGGSNLLVSDKGFKGLVIKNSCRRIEVNKNKIIAQSGAKLKDLVNMATSKSLSGMEFCAGIPGTVGGAVWGNAGAFGHSIGELLWEAVLLRKDGEIEIVNRDYFDFDYRESRLKKSKELLLSAAFLLRKGKNERIKLKVDNHLAERMKRLPKRHNSAGCFFKNIVTGDGKKISAGFLLDQVKAKELRIGDAAVFDKHANVLINRGKAKAKEVKELARIIKDRVKKRFGIKLEEEVVFVGF